MRTIAKSISAIPTHCIKITFSPNKTKAIVTETGNSKEETMLPNPSPAFGNPTLNKIGGIMVPKSDKIKPYFHKIE